MAIIPIQGSMNYRMCEFIYQQGGKCTADELRRYFIELKGGDGHSAVYRVAQYGYATRTDGEVILAPHIERYFDGLAKQERYKGAIVPPRHVDLLNRPELTGYGPSLLKGKRDGVREGMSFLRTSSQYLPQE